MNRLRRLVGDGLRRPRACQTQGTLPGGAGAPPGDTTVPCQELADGMGLAPARGSDARQPAEGNWRKRADGEAEVHRKRGPAPQGKRRDGAPRGATRADEVRVPRRTSRLSARRPPRFFRRGNLEKLGRGNAPRERWSLPA